MPLAFPSHQGLILPLARRWPACFDGLALCVGAAMPDVVDGVRALYRGRLGQWYGHSLLGALTVCWLGGLLLTWLLRALAERIARRSDSIRRFLSALSTCACSAPTRLNAPLAATARDRFMTLSFSLWIGALSHILWDLVSHPNSPLFLPWHRSIQVFPSWGQGAWLMMPVPFHGEPYPFGPPLAVWGILSVAGAWLFFAPLLRKRIPADERREERASPTSSGR